MTSRQKRRILAITTGLDSYQTALLGGFTRVAQAAGFPVLAYVNHEDQGGHSSIGENPKVPDMLRCLVLHHRPAGVVVTNSLSQAQEEALTELLRVADLPVVYIGRDVTGYTSVRGDNESAMRLIMGHLLDSSRSRRPVMIRGLQHQPDHVAREQIFRSELTRRGYSVDEDLFLEGRAGRDTSGRAMRSLLSRRRDFDAVVTTDDWCAASAIAALNEAGLRVPQDVAVTGFDNYPVSLLTWPGITTIDQCLEEQGALAARSLIAEISGTQPVSALRVQCRLVARGSTARTADDPSLGAVRAEEISRLAQEQLNTANMLRSANRSLLKSKTMEAVGDALTPHLKILGFERFFLIMHERPYSPEGEYSAPISQSCEPERGDDVTHARSWLALDFRQDSAHTEQHRRFSSCQLLPEYLNDELDKGFLALQSVFTVDGIVGYILTDHVLDHTSVAELLWVDLARTLEIVIDSLALKAHSTMLERIVAKRTAELENEVRTRRRAEVDLHLANAELQRMLEVDGLTRIANRTAFDRYLRKQWQMHLQADAKLAVVMVDVDCFKAFNDLYGHLAGDDVLRSVASCLQQAVSYSGDLACRFGGEEFALVLPRTGVAGAHAVAERFMALLSECGVPHDASPVAHVVTASIGIAALAPSPALAPESLVSLADRALYQAKARGRNQIVIHNSTHEQVRPECMIPAPRHSER